MNSSLFPFVALIPARMESTRFPGKALALLGGEPMVVWCARRARASGAQRVVVATDHPAILEQVCAAGFEAVLTSSAHSSGTDRLAEAAALLELPGDSLVVNVQGDEPLVDPDLIRIVAEKLALRPDCVMATAGYPIRQRSHLHNPNAVKLIMNHAGEAIYFSRAPIPWLRDQDGAEILPEGMPAWHHVGLYAYRSAFLATFAGLEPSPLERCEALEQLRVLWHGYRIAVCITAQAPVPGVDTPEDLERVRALWELNPTNPAALD